MQVSNLLRPGLIGALELRNRMVMAPMVTNFADAEGFVTDRTVAWYTARAAGGVGLVIVEATCVQSPVGRAWRHGLVADDDRFIPGLARLAAEVHSKGAKVALQLQHAGRHARRDLCGADPVGPSTIPEPVAGAQLPHELTIEEIHEIVECFARAGERAKVAGFDAVEIHGAHRYLGAQFLSTSSNRRSDQYGGSVEKRSRFLVEVVEAVKVRTGPEFPVWCRLNGREYGVEGGIALSEAKVTSRLLEKAGADGIHVSALGWGVESHRAPVTDSTLPGPLLYLARGVKEVVSIPVLGVGMMSPAVAERALREGSADFVCFARELIADPEFPVKIASGRLDEIRPCIGCQTCVHLIRDGSSPLQCAVNAVAGYEDTLGGPVPSSPKKVLVVGGGPAGMEAARQARLRGHSVTLCEKEAQLGGQLLQAARAPWKERIGDFTRYLSRQLDATGVVVELSLEATPELLRQARPDVVVFATGATPLLPEIPGVSGANVIFAADALLGRADVGDRVVVVGGELVGCEVAEFLADRGRSVVVVRRGPEMATRVLAGRRQFMIERLKQKGVVLLTGVEYRRIVGDGLVVSIGGEGECNVQADTIVLAAGSVPNADLSLNPQCPTVETLVVGDCVDPRSILAAVHEGNRAGQII